jgi:hypothetical protein
MLTCRAQVPTSPVISIDDIQSKCVEIDGYPVAVESDECNVVDFGLLTSIEGYAFFYARYLITAEVPSWPGLRERGSDANALIMFVSRDASGYASVYRTYHEDFSEFVFFSFPVPTVFETSLGTVLHIERRGSGGGLQQWFNDEYWLWRWNDWQRLDVTSWYADINSYVPPGYAVHGVSPDHFDLINLRNISPVRRMDDPMCCPSGGIVTATFQWVDLVLAIREVVYDPDADFRSLSE